MLSPPAPPIFPTPDTALAAVATQSPALLAARFVRARMPLPASGLAGVAIVQNRTFYDGASPLSPSWGRPWRSSEGLTGGSSGSHATAGPLPWAQAKYRR